MTNKPTPPEPEAHRAYLGETYATIVARAEELLGSYDRAPSEITSDEIAKGTGDLVRLITDCRKQHEAARVGEKSPWDAVAGVAHNFFKSKTDKLDTAKANLERRLRDWLVKKEREERDLRAAAERVAREAALAAEKARIETEAALKTEADLRPAIEAEQVAVDAQRDLRAAETATAAKPADLARTRSDNLGSLSTLQQIWTFDGLDRAKLDLEALRPHIPEQALEQAVRSFIKAGGRTLAGVNIYEDRKALVR